MLTVQPDVVSVQFGFGTNPTLLVPAGDPPRTRGRSSLDCPLAQWQTVNRLAATRPHGNQGNLGCQQFGNALDILASR
jgi:hypothetical protein